MIQSMTAFARSQGQGEWGSVVCEMRSINHRYLEMSLRLSESLGEIENGIRERIRQFIKRGKIECHLRFQPGNTANNALKLNTVLAKQLCDANEKISKFADIPASFDTIRVLQWPGVLQIEEINLDLIQDEILKVLEKVLNALVEARKREGSELKKIFLQRLLDMKKETIKVRTLLPEVLEQQRQRLIARFKEASVELDPVRLEQEMIIFSHKIDVAEELDRLDTHIAEVERNLQQGGAIGRRLDFLMQELNREANTLGSKSVNVEITRAAVELKVLIEQVREQVQNIE